MTEVHWLIDHEYDYHFITCLIYPFSLTRPPITSSLTQTQPPFLSYLPTGLIFFHSDTAFLSLLTYPPVLSSLTQTHLSYLPTGLIFSHSDTAFLSLLLTHRLTFSHSDTAFLTHPFSLTDPRPYSPFSLTHTPFLSSSHMALLTLSLFLTHSFTHPWYRGTKQRWRSGGGQNSSLECSYLIPDSYHFTLEVRQALHPPASLPPCLPPPAISLYKDVPNWKYTYQVG